MLTLEAMRTLRSAYTSNPQISEETALETIGNPTREEIIATALAGMKNEDRNVRVLMLRVLAAQQGKDATLGILAGLQDDQRRVKMVAIKSCTPFLSYPAIVEQLEKMATDEQETNKIRGGALHALTGHGVGTSLHVLPKAAAEALETLFANAQYREKILLNLLMLDLSEQVELLLQEFVTSGSKHEALMATKALCGYQVVNLGSFDDETIVREITQTCDRAAGEVFFWVKRTDLD